MSNQHSQVPINPNQGLHSYIETSAELIGSSHEPDLEEVNSDSDSGQPPVDARPTVREAKWSEIRKYVEFLRRYAYSENTGIDLSKENFYDLYGMAIHLLRAIDSLDPDKVHQPPYPFSRREYMMPQQATVVSPQMGSPSDGTPSPMYDMYYRPYAVYSDNSYDSKKRKSNSNANKRNLICQNCGATKTPEWRRGPSGDHTLCNACGLQYAKGLKKQKKDQANEAAKQAANNGLSSMGSISSMSSISNVNMNTLSSVDGGRSSQGMDSMQSSLLQLPTPSFTHMPSIPNLPLSSANNYTISGMGSLSLPALNISDAPSIQ